MMQWARVLVFLGAMLGVLSWQSPSSAEGAATATVRRANDALRDLLRKKVPAGGAEEKKLTSEVTNRLGSFLDVDELGRRALRDHWSKLGADERREFARLLRELVEANYVKALRSRLDYGVSYLDESASGSGVKVSTEVTALRNGRKQTMSIDYVLHRQNDDWRVFDLVTDGVGLVENYRSQFNKVIAKEGVEGLLARMRKKKLEGG
jgi:phospholipid transport system substrate-binding protein